MLYEELKAIDTKDLLVKVGDYVALANKYINENDPALAQKILGEIQFFVDYHQYVNLKSPDEYDFTSLSFIKAWNEQNGKKRY